MKAYIVNVYPLDDRSFRVQIMAEDVFEAEKQANAIYGAENIGMVYLAEGSMFT